MSFNHKRISQKQQFLKNSIPEHFLNRFLGTILTVNFNLCLTIPESSLFSKLRISLGLLTMGVKKYKIKKISSLKVDRTKLVGLK